MTFHFDKWKIENEGVKQKANCNYSSDWITFISISVGADVGFSNNFLIVRLSSSILKTHLIIKYKRIRNSKKPATIFIIATPPIHYNWNQNQTFLSWRSRRWICYNGWYAASIPDVCVFDIINNEESWIINDRILFALGNQRVITSKDRNCRVVTTNFTTLQRIHNHTIEKRGKLYHLPPYKQCHPPPGGQCQTGLLQHPWSFQPG